MNVTLADWPVARRLYAVIAAALVMGLVFGGLRVADAENSASQFGKTEQLAKLSAQLLGVSQDLQNEEDATDVALISGKEGTLLPQLQAKTNSDLVPVRASLQQVLNGGFPAAVVSDASAVSNALSAANVGPALSQNNQGNVASTLHGLFNTQAANGEAVLPEYESDLSDIFALQAQVSLGITDQSLNSDVQALSALAQAKDLTSQELTILDQSLANTSTSSVTDANGNSTFDQLPFASETSLQLDYQEEQSAEHSFQATATQAEQSEFDDLLGPQADKLDGETVADAIVNAFFTAAGGGANVPSEEDATGTYLPSFIGNQLNGPNGVLNLVVSMEQNDQTNNSPAPQSAVQAAAAVQHAEAVTSVPTLKTKWDQGTNAKLAAMRSTEQFVASNVVTRATQLQQAAQQTALIYIVITALVLLIILFAALLVARSLVLPLRRLRAGALDIASVQLPERVRLLSDNLESAPNMEIAPIDVTSQDEIGEVARAFDQVHSEAVRLAGEQALLRSSFNAMFVNLSRRSQTLIERLARMIDNQEQTEDDPDRLGGLFSMDHLVTRMRRNSENLLLLAGHDNPRKWTESVPIADVARAATSEIEQYNRVTLNIPPGVSVTGQAVSDVVHLLAELVENATSFSPKDTPVHVRMQELTSGGVLIEVLDTGIGVSEARLAEMNFRLDNPPTIDVSVSRHMGLFAVAKLAERHRVRVRLRPAVPQGLSALVWLPDAILERSGRFVGDTSGWSAQPVGARTRAGTGAMESAALTSGGGGSVGLAADYGNGYGYGNGVAEGAMGGQIGGFSVGEPPAGDQRVTGLPVRVPRASMPQGTGDSTPGTEHGLPGWTAGNGNGTAKSGSALPQRSPEQARSRLAGFQRGARRAEGQGSSGSGAQAPRAGEGTNVELRIPAGPELARQRFHRARTRRGARGCRLRRRRAAGFVRRHPRVLRRAAGGHHVRAGQPHAGCREDLLGGPADSGARRDGGRPDDHQDDRRRIEPLRAGLARLRHRDRLLRDVAPGRGGRRGTLPGPARQPATRHAGTCQPARRRRSPRLREKTDPVGTRSSAGSVRASRRAGAGRPAGPPRRRRWR
jgi:signal transduction histidine kinase